MEVDSETTIIEVSADNNWRTYWSDIWRYRDLLYILSWRDLKVRYKQTLIGAAWALLRPLLTMVIFTFVFGEVAGLEDSKLAPYPLIVMAGVLAWQLLANVMSACASSLITNEKLITKVYFPRLLLPISTILTCLVDFGIALIVFLLLFVYWQHWPSWQFILIPIWLILTICLALGIGLTLATINIQFRDVRYALPFLIQLGLFVSPVGFVSDQVPNLWKWLYELNPAVGLIDSFRWCAFGGDFPWKSTLLSTGWTVLMLIIGMIFFLHRERTFADTI